MLNNEPQLHLKLFYKEQFKKIAEAGGDLIGNKMLIKLRKSREVFHRIVQKQLQMKQKILSMIKKYLKE